MGEIDFANADSRKTYLKDNLGHLMNGIDSNYGQVLMDELMRRMETTVSEFNDEVKAMLGQLQGIKPTPRDNILASAPRQAPPAPPMQKAAPAPPTTELKPAVEEPVRAPEPPKFASEEPETFAAPPQPPAPKAAGGAKEVEIEVDLPAEELTDFEKKLRSLTQ